MAVESRALRQAHDDDSMTCTVYPPKSQLLRPSAMGLMRFSTQLLSIGHRENSSFQTLTSVGGITNPGSFSRSVRSGLPG
jgi:hypothetical protein